MGQFAVARMLCCGRGAWLSFSKGRQTRQGSLITAGRGAPAPSGAQAFLERATMPCAPGGVFPSVGGLLRPR